MNAGAPGNLLGKFRLQTKVGSGGMGEVWRAETTGAVHRTVAIKLISTSGGSKEWLTRSLLTEARAMVSLPLHPNLVALHDVIEQDDLVALVMEFVEGLGLRERLARHTGGLSWADLYPIAKGLLDGVAHAHAHGLLHLDLKPENVRLRPLALDAPLLPEDIKILDFGLARYASDPANRTGEIFGTLGYMSPEQFTGGHGPACDQYAIGLILFELITGQAPYRVSQNRYEDWCLAHTMAPIPFLTTLREDVPQGLEAVVRKALGKDPTDRHADVATLARELLPELAYLAQWQGAAWQGDGADVGVPLLQGLEPGDLSQAHAMTARVAPESGEPPAEATVFAVQLGQAPVTQMLKATAGFGFERQSAQALALLARMGVRFMGEGATKDLFSELLTGLCTHVKAAGGLLLVQEEAGLTPWAAWGTSATGEVRFSASLLAAVLQDQQAMVLGPAEFQGALGAVASIRARSLHTALVAPLEYEGRIEGLLYLDGSLDTRPFTEADLQVAVALAQLGAARLVRDRR